MENRVKLLGFIAIVAIIGLVMLACGDGSGEDGITINGITFIPYTDAGDGGTSTISMTRGTGSDINNITVSGNVAKIPGKEYGFAGLSIRLNSRLVEFRNSELLGFYCAGDGNKAYVAEVRTSDITDYGYFYKTFTAPSTKTETIINYNELQRPDWCADQTKTFNKSKITQIDIQATTGVTGEGSFSLTIFN